VIPSLERRLLRLLEKREELARRLGETSAQLPSEERARLGREFARLEDLARAAERRRVAHDDLRAARELLAASPPGEERRACEDEVRRADEEVRRAEEALLALLVPTDPRADRNAFLEIRAGTGGLEAALFAGELQRMYARYAERRGWRVEVLVANRGELGGFREITTRIEGAGVYGRLRHEAGTHRVQRVPVTEAQGRIHTSTCTVAVLPEVEEDDALVIRPQDLEVDTFRASGAGGQHVNKTESAVRITHRPSGLVVECQDERSQHQNRARALALLRARLLAMEEERRESRIRDERRAMIGRGERSERIRTYNFPQTRVTDHRLELTLYRLGAILDGDLDPLLDPLEFEARGRALAALADAD
jgi:peptide chain release factor 1